MFMKVKRKNTAKVDNSKKEGVISKFIMTLNKIDFGISLEQVLDYIEKISRIKFTLNTKNRLRNRMKSKTVCDFKNVVHFLIKKDKFLHHFYFENQVFTC